MLAGLVSSEYGALSLAYKCLSFLSLLCLPPWACLRPHLFLLQGRQSQWIRAHPKDLILLFKITYLQIQSHFKVAEVKSEHSLGGVTI